MAGVQDTNVLDLIGHMPDGEVILAIVEDRAWHADPRQLDDLRRKLENYAAFVVGGQLTSQYPNLVGQPVRIQIDCPEPPSGEIAAFLERLTPDFEELGLRLVVNARGW